MPEQITARAKKGAAVRTLSAKVRELLAREPRVNPEMRNAVQGCHAAANKLIARTAPGETLTIQIVVAQGPLGGWNASVMIDAEPTEET